MNTTKATLIIFLLGVLLLVGCKDINYEMPIKEPTINSVDVYLAGARKNGIDSIFSATYWKNGTPVTVGNSSVSGSLFSIIATDTAIFVAGYERGILKYWRNGFATSLGDSAHASGMHIGNSSVYLAGWTPGDSAVLWVNGARTTLDHNAAAASVSTAGQNVYVGGYHGNTTDAVPMIWENGKSTGDLLSNGEINAIVVVGNLVYAAGNYLATASQKPRACYWKNSTPFILSGTEYAGGANSIFVLNGDVYVAGFESNSNGVKVAKYWKNGVAVVLSDGTRSQEAHAIAVTGNDVYVTCDGLIANSSILFKNGKVVQPFDGSSNNYYAFGLALK